MDETRPQVTGLFDPELVAALPPKLQFLTHNGAGYDRESPCDLRGGTSA